MPTTVDSDGDAAGASKAIMGRRGDGEIVVRAVDRVERHLSALYRWTEKDAVPLGSSRLRAGRNLAVPEEALNFTVLPATGLVPSSRVTVTVPLVCTTRRCSRWRQWASTSSPWIEKPKR